MSVVMEQHERWAPANARLWGKPLRPKRMAFIPPAPRVPDPVPYGAPIDLYQPASWKTIVQLVALKHDMTAEDILGRKRSRSFIDARREAVMLCYSHLRRTSHHLLGAIFKREHTTIFYLMRPKYRLTSKATDRFREAVQA